MKNVLKFMLIFALVTTYACNAQSNEKKTSTAVVQKTEKTNNTAATQQKGQYQNVDPDAFEKLIASGKGQLLDVRTPAEFAQGHLKGAEMINFMDQDFVKNVQKLDKNKPVYIYCRSGARSGRAMKKLEADGFTEIYNLIGGIGAWSKSHKEVVK